MRSIKYKSPIHGMSPESGFDCSGLICYVLALAKLEFPQLIVPSDIRHANEMFDGLGILVHSQLRSAADIVFITKNGDYPSHVGILVNPDYMIHGGTESGKVDVSEVKHHLIISVANPARTQIYSYNPIGYKRLTVAISSVRFHQQPI